MFYLKRQIAVVNTIFPSISRILLMSTSGVIYFGRKTLASKLDLKKSCQILACQLPVCSEPFSISIERWQGDDMIILLRAMRFYR